MQCNSNKDSRKGRVVYIKSFGCQMNVRDSEIVRGMLEEAGYGFVESPRNADIVIFNTCSVREHAEHRAISNLAAIARKKPRRIFGLIGCVAQHRKESLFKIIPNLDFVCGPSDIYEIPKLLDKVQDARNKKQTNYKLQITNYKSRSLDCINPQYRESKTHAYVNIMYGCNNFCSYCIVPYVRGREVSRPVKDILREIEELAARGIKEITLLGQNVNSYKSELSAIGYQLSTKKHNFVQLLRLVNDVDGIEKISFMTSHPKDASSELFKAMRDLDKIDRRLHLPLQSGSNRILRLMNRGYTVERYNELARNYRDLVPNARLTTDIMVGFPTEKEEDFNKTKQILQDLRFDGAYIFKYSLRPPAKSHLMEDDVSLDIKKLRNNVLLELQKRISKETRDERRGMRDDRREAKSSILHRASSIIRSAKTAFLLLVATALLCLNFNSFAYDRDEKRALENIEALFLKEDFQAVKTKCDRFLRDYRGSRLSRRARHLREIASRKISGHKTVRSEAQPPRRGQDTKRITHDAKRTTQNAKDTYYIVQVGAFGKYKNAIKLKRSLGRQGFESVVLKVRKGERIFYRVRAGKFRELENARDLVRSLKKKGYSSEIINEE